MSKEINTALMDVARNAFSGHETIVVVDGSRLTGIDSNRFRRELRAGGIKCVALRSGLARRGAYGTVHQSLSAGLTGAVTLTYGDLDSVEHAKLIIGAVKTYQALSIRAGSVCGELLDGEGVVSLSKSPGRAELLSGIVAQILGAGGRLSGGLIGVGSNLCGAVAATGCSEIESE